MSLPPAVGDVLPDPRNSTNLNQSSNNNNNSNRGDNRNTNGQSRRTLQTMLGVSGSEIEKKLLTRVMITCALSTLLRSAGYGVWLYVYITHLSNFIVLPSVLFIVAISLPYLGWTGARRRESWMMSAFIWLNTCSICFFVVDVIFLAWAVPAWQSYSICCVPRANAPSTQTLQIDSSSNYAVLASMQCARTYYFVTTDGSEDGNYTISSPATPEQASRWTTHCDIHKPDMNIYIKFVIITYVLYGVSSLFNAVAAGYGVKLHRTMRNGAGLNIMTASSTPWLFRSDDGNRTHTLDRSDRGGVALVPVAAAHTLVYEQPDGTKIIRPMGASGGRGGERDGRVEGEGGDADVMGYLPKEEVRVVLDGLPLTDNDIDPLRYGQGVGYRSTTVSSSSAARNSIRRNERRGGRDTQGGSSGEGQQRELDLEDIPLGESVVSARDHQPR